MIDLGTLGGTVQRRRAINERREVTGAAETEPGVYHALALSRSASDD
jgi:hypothetical protein